MELPASFIESTCALLGDDEYNKLSAALDEKQPVSIRLNADKLGDVSFPHPRVPWSSTGFYLERRPAFTFDPLFHAGCFYVQEASSMFVEQALRQLLPDKPVVMLDLCAAPGGKSTHARSVLPAGSLLVANELIRNRSQILAENLTKWGHPGVAVTNNDPADFSSLEAFFDVVLTDVPCSGEGMFRKDPVAVSEWSPENVDICWQRQRRIITDIWPCLKPGGILIYSTCTYNTKENEENIRWMRDELGAEVLRLNVSDDWNITGNLLPGEDFPVYRFLPHKTTGEGFFLAALRKPGIETGTAAAATETVREKGRKNQIKEAQARIISPEQLRSVGRWLADSEDYEWLVGGCRVSAFPREYVAQVAALSSSVRVVQVGVDVAELKGRDWMPAHGLAMSTALCPDAFARQEIGYEQAIAYLHKEAVVLPAEAPRGVVLLTYKQIPLGFVKNIGNRANNLYPHEWRIRSGYLPGEVLGLATVL